MNSLATLSADLRRVSYWKIQNQDAVANQFLKSSLEMYAHLPETIGAHSLEDTLKRIMTLDRRKAAELAMMTSVILSSKI